MKRVLCTLPNASESISGVTFVEHVGGMLSDEIDEALADIFLSVDGFIDFIESEKEPEATGGTIEIKEAADVKPKK
jgi:hypothetical protein